MKKAKAPFKPTAQGNPSRNRSNKSWRIALPLLLLLAVIIGSILSVYFVNKLTNTNHEAQSTQSSSQIDYLKDSNAWPVDNAIYFFKSGQYHINNTSPDIATAFYSSGNNIFANFSLTITMTEVHGSLDRGDFYGVIFRSSPSQNSYYFFEIDTCCGTVQYSLQYYNGQSKPKEPWNTVKTGLLTSLASNLGRTNVITLVAKGSSFEFLVNGKSIGKPITDHLGDVFLSGEIGLAVEEKNTEVAFSQLHIVRQ